MTAIMFGASVAKITGTYSSALKWLKLTVAFVNITPKHLKLKAKIKPDLLLRAIQPYSYSNLEGSKSLKNPTLSALLSSSCQISSEYMHHTKIIHLW